MVHCLRYRAYPGHVICFRGGGPKAGRRRFMVHLLSRGSQIKYYGRSHLHELPTEETDYLFYEVPQAALDQAGLHGEVLDFDDGGRYVDCHCLSSVTPDNFHRVTFDARTCIEIKQGYALTFLFATEDVLSTTPPRPPMYLPNIPRLRNKVSEMESSEIGLNFAFRDPPRQMQTADNGPSSTDTGRSSDDSAV
jgi:hypothetical protein